MERQVRFAVVAQLFLLVAGCGGTPTPKRTVPRAGQCRVKAATAVKQGAPRAIGSETTKAGFTLQTCADNVASGQFDTPCACDDYQGRYPMAPPTSADGGVDSGFAIGVDQGIASGVFDEQATMFCSGCGSEGESSLPGCTSNTAKGRVDFA